MCDAFGCTPSVAVRELERDPVLVFDILQLRAYADTKQAIDRAKTAEQAPTGPMVDLVMDIQAELIAERRQARADDEDDEDD